MSSLIHPCLFNGSSPAAIISAICYEILVCAKKGLIVSIDPSHYAQFIIDDYNPDYTRFKEYLLSHPRIECGKYETFGSYSFEQILCYVEFHFTFMGKTHRLQNLFLENYGTVIALVFDIGTVFVSLGEFHQITFRGERLSPKHLTVSSGNWFMEPFQFIY